jgi:shikimate kinase
MNIYMIGYRGSGKTSLGRAVAVKLGRVFFDTDDLIVEREGKSIPKIFEEDGESYFRDCETEALRGVSKTNNKVVATGGGIVMREENRRLLKESGVCVYLFADTDVLYKRIVGDTNRPSLTGKDAYSEIEELLKVRIPYYKELADISVDTGNNGFVQTLDIIFKELNKIEENK